jgi:hypothetical protein
MESAFTYLASLVEAFEDVGKGNGNKKNKHTSSVWNQAALPSCGINVTDCNSAKDYPLDTDSDSVGFYADSVGIYDIERQAQHPRSNEDEDNNDDDGNYRIKKSASNRSSHRRKQHQNILSVPSISEKKSSWDILKSKSSDLASRLSLFQSFSGGSSNRHDPTGRNVFDIAKSKSSISNTTNETSTDADVENDDSDLDWSIPKQHSKKTTKRKLPPPPSHPHFQWCAHGLVWTCMAITFGWVGVGLSFAARQSTGFVQLKEPMYLDPRYEKISAVGMIQLELCFNETHLDILEELNDDDQLEAQPGNRMFDLPLTDIKSHDYKQANDFVADVIDDATIPCIVHRLTSDDVHDDAMYTMSVSTAFLAMVFGGFVTICLTFSAFWKTINLRPIGAGYLIAYFLQSFTFLIFDSNLCKDNMGCSMSRGGTLSAIASVCWIISCATCARMDSRKFRNEQKEKEIREQRYRDSSYPQRRKSQKDDVEQQAYPQHIIIEKEIQKRLTKPIVIAAQNRAITAETADETSDDDSTPSSDDNQTILYDLNADPIYIPTLPDSQPSSSRSLKKKSKKPRSTSSLPKDKNSTDNEVEERKKPRSKKSKGEKIGYHEDEGLVESQLSSASLTNKEEATKKPRSSKRINKSIKQSMKAENQQDQQERPRSPIRSRKIDMTGDVNDVNSGEEMKNSTQIRPQSAMTSTQAQQNHAKAKKRSSSRPRKVKSGARTGNAATRASVRKSIEEGKHYEL